MIRRRSIGMLLLTLAVACGPMPEAAAPVSPSAAPTAASSPALTAAAPAAPTATSAPIPASVPTSSLRAGGTAGFRDHLAVADQIAINLAGVPAPPDGQAYQGWLVGDDGVVTHIAALEVDPDGSIILEWNSPTGDNLLSRYAGFQVSVETAPAESSPAPTIIMGGGLEGELLTVARRLFVRNDGEPATPRDSAFALGLRAQTDVAVQHVQNAVNAAAIGAMPEMRLHLEHVINILEGQDGPRFGDYNGDGRPENPGDGFGVIGYASHIAELLSSQSLIVTAAADVGAQSEDIQEKASEIVTLDDMAAARAQLEELKTRADQLKAGPVAELYQAAQEAISFNVKMSE